jgi:YVTN family beta-propeller protein
MTTTSVGRACVLATLAAGLAGCAAVGGHVTGGNTLSPSAVLATIPVGVPPTLLAISPDGSRVFAASSGQLAIIDTTTNTATVSVAIPAYTTGVTVTPDGARVLVDGLRATRLVVVDAASGSRLPPIDLVVDIHPGGFGRIAVSADGRRAYVTNQPKEYLAQVDLTTGTTTERSLDLRPSDVTLGKDGRTIYVTGCQEFCTTGTVELIDTATFTTVRSFDVGPGPYRFALSPDERRAYTTNLGGPTLSVIDVASGGTLATVPVGVEPSGLAVSPDGARVYVASQRQQTLVIVDATTNTPTGTVSLPSQPREVVLSPDGGRAYVSVRNAVLVLDTKRL